MSKEPLEKDVHRMLCKWLKFQFPNVIYRTDFAAGMRLSIGQARLQKELQHSRAYPDLHIVEPRGEYCGLFLEIKRSRDQVYKKDGSLKNDEHIKEQHEMLIKLREKGYKAEFGLGLEDCMSIIYAYLKS
jgi:hypothetical protein